MQRVFAQSSVVKKVAEGLRQLALEAKVGDPMSEETQIGPLINPREVSRVHAWVKEALRKDGKLLCGGRKIGKTCYEPTVILNPRQRLQALSRARSSDLL